MLSYHIILIMLSKSLYLPGNHPGYISFLLYTLKVKIYLNCIKKYSMFIFYLKLL